MPGVDFNVLRAEIAMEQVLNELGSVNSIRFSNVLGFRNSMRASIWHDHE